MSPTALIYFVFLISVTFINVDADHLEDLPEISESFRSHEKIEALRPQISFGEKLRAHNVTKTIGNLRGSTTSVSTEKIISKSLISQEITTDNYVKKRQHRVLNTVNLEIINNCDYNAYAYLIFERENSIDSWQWQLFKKGSSVTITGVDRTKIWIYGIHATDFSDAWTSVSSYFCYAKGDCFRRIDLSGLPGEGDRIQYSTCQTSEPSNAPSFMPSIEPTPRPEVETFVAFQAPPAPSESAELESSSQQQQWLDEHNSRRHEFYNLFPERYGLDSSPLKWSDSVATSAQNYVNKLIQLDGCQGQHNFGGDSYGGENIAWNTGREARTPAEVLTDWYDREIDINNLQLLGMKYHASQVVFRSSRYLGCGQAEKRMKNNQMCYMQVCRYIGTGNCFLTKEMSQYFPDRCIEDYPDAEWVCSALSDSASRFCTADEDELCPAEGCF